MADKQTNWILNLIDKVTRPMGKVTASENDGKAAIDKTTQAVEKQQKALGKLSAIDVQAIGAAFGNISNDIKAATEPGVKFDSQLHELSAITGASGEQLDKLGEAARKTAVAFGGDAADQVESYKTILSRLGPDIAKVPAAVDNMGKSVQTLSKTMGGDAVAATDALTTAMLQYQVDLNDPLSASMEMANMMNVMAAGAKYGAAEVPQISEALKQAGVQAKLANLSFEEVNAAIQAMATGGKFGSEAGVAIRNVITQMSAPGALSGDAVKIMKAYHINMKAVSDVTVPFADRLKRLAPIQNDINALTEIFGRENASSAAILIRNANAQEQMTKQITGTNTATEQANTIMGGYGEAMKRVGAWVDDVKISVFGATQQFLPFITVAADSMVVLANLSNAKQGLTMITQALTKATWVSNIATKALAAGQWLLNAAFIASPIGWVVTVVAGLTAGVMYAWNRFEGFRGFLYGLWGTFKQVFTNIKGLFTAVFSPIGKAIQAISENRWGDAAKAFLELNPISMTKRGFDYVDSGGLTKGVVESYAASEKEGRKSFQDDKKKKEEKVLAVDQVTAGGAPKAAPLIVPPAGGTTKSGTGLDISGSGGSGGKIVTMTLTVVNHFHQLASKMDVRKVADQIAEQLSDKMRDEMLIIS